ncbi:MAG: tetratricopeptide repeat protein [Bacteroidota bacterium]
MKSLRIYLFGLLSFLILSPAIAQDETERFMDRGREAYFDRDYERAVYYFEEVAQIDTYYKDLYEYRGNAFFKLGEYREAELDYLEAIELLPKPDRGSSRRVGDDFVLLDPNGDEDLNQRYARLYNNLAVTRFKMGKRTAAEKAFETARNYDPDSEIIRDNERSADYDRSNELQIVDEASINKRKKNGRDSSSDKAKRGYENEFNRRPVALWEVSDRDAYSMMIDVREAREEEVARDEMDADDPKDENIFSLLFF